jgi:menaquinol-cytochrome c reductase iron-sulfur subunit
MKEKQKLSRRGFLGIATFSIGGLISAIVGIPAIAYIIDPASKGETDQNWIPLGAVTKVEIGNPTLFKAQVQKQAGWIVDEQELTFYVLTDDGREFSAMSNVCTHLGCHVRWVADEGEFFCPCHNGVFDKNGAVVSGPPPRSLDRYEVKAEDGQLFVLGG